MREGPLEDDVINDDQIRSAEEVAYRALALYPVVSAASGADRQAILGWLAESGLNEKLAPSEAAFMAVEKPEKSQVIQMTWMSERLIVLLWALNAVDEFPAADEQCQIAYGDILPPFGPVDMETFLSEAKLRPDTELIAAAEDMMALHWDARNARFTGQVSRRPVDLEIIQERHAAINWVTGYEGLPWDEVTTDT
jgi:hypothetical protein